MGRSDAGGAARRQVGPLTLRDGCLWVGFPGSPGRPSIALRPHALVITELGDEGRTSERQLPWSEVLGMALRADTTRLPAPVLASWVVKALPAVALLWGPDGEIPTVLVDVVLGDGGIEAVADADHGIGYRPRDVAAVQALLDAVTGSPAEAVDDALAQPERALDVVAGVAAGAIGSGPEQVRLALSS